jgi:hypothetical protein
MSMPPADPDLLTRDIRRVFAIAGLPESHSGESHGGYGLAVRPDSWSSSGLMAAPLAT